MMIDFAFLLLPVAAGSGWVMANRNHIKKRFLRQNNLNLPHDYLRGINFLLNEEPDKALDVFIKLLEVDSETIETHLALGNLFRRRGEVERAIRIHQNLIARPTLEKKYKATALLELARDYFSAGVLDRSEKLFLELIRKNEFVDVASKNLLSIYQQEKEWSKAINNAKKIGKEYNSQIAHFYCELAAQNYHSKKYSDATKLLKKALAYHSKSARANLLLADIATAQKQYAKSNNYLKNIPKQNANCIAEMIPRLIENYKAINKETELKIYLQKLLEKYSDAAAILCYTEQIKNESGRREALEFLAAHINKNPSLKGVNHLIKMYLPYIKGDTKKDLKILLDLIEKIIAQTNRYSCKHCGYSSNKLYWLCPSCNNWDGMVS